MQLDADYKSEHDIYKRGFLDGIEVGKRLSRSSSPSDCASGQCDECDQPSIKTIRDASGNRQLFCLEHWSQHVAFTGNNGSPYGF